MASSFGPPTRAWVVPGDETIKNDEALAPRPCISGTMSGKWRLGLSCFLKVLYVGGTLCSAPRRHKGRPVKECWVRVVGALDMR